MEWLWIIQGVIGLAMLVATVLTFLILVFAAVQMVKGDDDYDWRK